MDFTPGVIEIWTLYGFGTLMIAARVFARTKFVGIRGYRPDDYLVWFVWMLYTSISVLAHIFIVRVQGKHTSLLTPEQRETLTPAESKPWEYGSQIFLAGFFAYVIILWTLKLNMLFFYQHLVRGLWMERAILPVMILVGVSLIAVTLTFTLMCIPFHKLWQVFPDPKGSCVPQNRVIFFTVLVLNLVTDFCIIIIPLPVIATMQTCILRKISLFFLLGLGIFCMIAAILRVVFIFNLNQEGLSALWTIREDFIAIFVSQAPMVYPITKPKFWKRLYSTRNSSSTRTLQGS
ncbi:hypothetical protein BGZ63DRAFT_422749 [Mariannaea sp. PMI_226]|nr:hypothetical protein BGZ63DRAFT_422749 [Mariannaea sp. PMI_226]